MLNGTVTGAPRASFVPALSGRPGAETSTALNAMFPVKTCETSSPTIGSAKSMTSVHRPEIGSSAYAVSDVPWDPLIEFWPYPPTLPFGSIR
jgi:hypothetical protein